MPLRVLLDRRVPMRDGVELALDVYLPPDGERFPVLLCRTIYDNQQQLVTTEAAPTHFFMDLPPILSPT